MITSVLRVVELFAGVGGFRIGLEGYKGLSASSGFTEDIKMPFETIWANQFEPKTKRQHAFEVYQNRFTGQMSNMDIAKVVTDDIPEHDLLVGGFPCQDYSVATSLKNSKGIQGKKGVLWWEIYRILNEMGEYRPKYIILENVDRLLKSPANQRGRDFAIMLKSLADLGYDVEWRIINAADYGFPQRRRRVFIVGYHHTTDISAVLQRSDEIDWIESKGLYARGFPIQSIEVDSIRRIRLSGDLKEISDSFQGSFENAGLMSNFIVTTVKSLSNYDGPILTLGDILVKDVSSDLFVDNKDLDKWLYLKGGKKIERVNSSGFKYTFSEGPLIFPDSLDKPSRTIVTGEGGPSPSRFKHIIVDPISGNYRRLSPIELERLNMFPDNHTHMEGITNQKRAFFMGNALVVGVVESIGRSLLNLINETIEVQ